MGRMLLVDQFCSSLLATVCMTISCLVVCFVQNFVLRVLDKSSQLVSIHCLLVFQLLHKLIRTSSFETSSERFGDVYIYISLQNVIQLIVYPSVKTMVQKSVTTVSVNLLLSSCFHFLVFSVDAPLGGCYFLCFISSVVQKEC